MTLIRGRPVIQEGLVACDLFDDFERSYNNFIPFMLGFALLHAFFYGLTGNFPIIWSFLSLVVFFFFFFNLLFGEDDSFY